MEQCFWRSTDLAEIQGLTATGGLTVLDFDALGDTDRDVLGSQILTWMGLESWTDIGAYDAVEILSTPDLDITVVAVLPTGGDPDNPDDWTFGLLECEKYRDPGKLSTAVIIGGVVAVGAAALLIGLAVKARPKRRSW